MFVVGAILFNVFRRFVYYFIDIADNKMSRLHIHVHVVITESRFFNIPPTPFSLSKEKPTFMNLCIGLLALVWYLKNPCREVINACSKTYQETVIISQESYTAYVHSEHICDTDVLCNFRLKNSFIFVLP